MSVRGTLGGVFAAIAVLIVGWQAGTAVSSTGASGATTTGSTTTGTSGSSTSGSSTSGSSSTGTSSSGLKDGTYTGASEETRYGSVQVRVTVSGGKVTDVTALQLTDDSQRSVDISNRAAPVLRQEVLAAQSAQVSNVSGATFTTDAYLQSVQSALDQAKA